MALQTIDIGTTANDATGDSARVWAAKSNANFQYLEALAGAAASEVEFTYTTVTTMYADQANQNVGKLEYVLDASGHADVTTAEARHFEYLGTTNGNATDYRLLSALESAGIIAGNADTFAVSAVQDDTIPLTFTAPTKIAFEYTDATNKISGVLFNLRYTDRMQRFVDLTASNTYYLEIYNKSKDASQIAKITGFATVNTDYTLASVADTITAVDVIDIGDVVQVRWHIGSTDIDGGTP